MKKRLLCVLVVAALLLCGLAGCGGGSSGSSDPGNSGAVSDKPDKGSQTDDDPVAVMNERVQAVNDAINYTFIELEETVEAGLLFYNLSYALPVPGETHDYNPNKPLDYRVRYQMYKGHTEGIVSEDTYVALLKHERYMEEVAVSNVIETDDLYIYYGPDSAHSMLGGYGSYCYILVKDTDIIYFFTVEELWYKADYYETGSPDRYTEEDAEYLFTSEFWKAFAQTVKFVGNPDDDFKKGECVNNNNSTSGQRSSYDHSKVKIPYIEEWYAGGHMSESAIYEGFGKFLQNCNREREVAVEVFFYFDDGTERTYPAIKRGDKVTIDLGNGQVWIYLRDEYEDKLIDLWEEPKNITGEHLPEIGYFNYTGDSTGFVGFMVIDDFGQGEPTMFFNNGLYRYAGGGEVTLIHDFSDIDDEWMGMSIDADRTRLLLSAGDPFGDAFKIVDLKTFEVTDTVYISYDLNEDDSFEFLGAAINGVTVDEETGQAKCDEWHSICNIHLLGRGSVEEINLNAAWEEYSRRS